MGYKDNYREATAFAFRYDSFNIFNIDDYDVDKITIINSTKNFTELFNDYKETVDNKNIVWINAIKDSLIPYKIVDIDLTDRYNDYRYYHVVYDVAKHRKIKINKILNDE